MSNAVAALNNNDELTQIKRELSAAVVAARDAVALDAVRVQALGKKGRITELLKTLGALAPDIRKERGAALNILKDEITALIEARQKELVQAGIQARLERERVDVTLDTRPQANGRIHPISQTIDEIITIFAGMGFTVAKGPDIESDTNNFA